MKYEQHELSAAFPSMPETDLQSLAADIKENGLHSPIVLYQGKVLDGWHRKQACERAGVNARAIEYKGKNPVAFVKSHNWHRRHMTESQKAMTQVRISEWREPGRANNSATVASLPPTAEQMAKDADVSKRLIVDAKAVEKNGSDALKTAVIEGEISVTKAAKVSKLPKPQQAKAMAEPKKKKEKPAPPPEDDSCSVAELGKALEASDNEVRALQLLVESLKKDDLAKEVAKSHMKYDQLEGRLHLAIKQKNEAEAQAKYSTGLLLKIREALKVQTNGEILQAIRNS